MASRYIPAEEDKEVKERHFFQCAWCGDHLFDRHHIFEFSEGGPNTAENLILLCPNCHRQAHQGKIDIIELKKRKSTHVKGDRMSGGFQVDITSPVFKIGGSTFRNVPILLAKNDMPLIGFSMDKSGLLLFTSFYNREGELIFWMSANRYWTLSNFNVTSTKNEMAIINVDDENNRIRIWKEFDAINIDGANYINGMPVIFGPNSITMGTNKITSSSAFNCLVGIQIRVL